jgi:plastocyanin
MGIMMAWAHPLAPGESPSTSYCTLPTTTTGSISPSPSPPNPTPVFGGSSAIGPDPSGQQPTYGPGGQPVTSIAIGGFGYSPGGSAPAAVAPGSQVTFTNLDAAASVFHTVTTCDAPCNLNYGQSYPLSSYGSATVPGVDSGELGYGPPFVTAATQNDSWTYTVPVAPARTTYTFFCRIHPFMRASLQVVG